ncbi:MAG: Mut7-C RNAse domain-containing protein [Elusimicrobiota bacterium]
MDYMLGRLCRWLRILGYDAEFYRGAGSRELVYRSLKERRVILSRSHKVDKHTAYKLYRVNSEDYKKQLKEVVENFNLRVEDSRIYSRCTECNRKLKPAKKSNIEDKVPRYIYKTHDKFSKCENCGKIYWRGTHRDLIKKVLKNLKDENNSH